MNEVLYFTCPGYTYRIRCKIHKSSLITSLNRRSFTEPPEENYTFIYGNNVRALSIRQCSAQVLYPQSSSIMLQVSPCYFFLRILLPGGIAFAYTKEMKNKTFKESGSNPVSLGLQLCIAFKYFPKKKS